jgi:hypothetical protein
MLRFGTPGRRWTGRLVALALAASPAAACKKKPPQPAAASLAEDALLTAMRERPVPDPAQSKLTVKISSKKLGIAAPPLSGGLIVDRPGKAYFTILSPFGGSVFTVATDGTTATMVNTQDRQLVRAADAASMLTTASGGSFALDDMIGVLQGLVPLTPESVTARADVAGGVQFTATGPANTTVTAVLEPTFATPVSLQVADAAGAPMVTATWEPFLDNEAGQKVPSHVIILVPSMELTLDVRYKSWSTLTTVPDVFTPALPDGYTEMTFEAYGALMKARMEAKQGD